MSHSTMNGSRAHTLPVRMTRVFATGKLPMAEIFKDLRKKEYLNAEGADKPPQVKF